MQELDKILEDIKEIFEDNKVIELNSDGTIDKCVIDVKLAWNDIKDIICKHMNDGWIPVEKDLPKNESEVWVVLESTYGTGYRTYSSARYLYFKNYGEGHWCDEHYGYLEWDKYSDGRGGSSQYKVIAWQPIEPYRPERRIQNNDVLR